MMQFAATRTLSALVLISLIVSIIPNASAISTTYSAIPEGLTLTQHSTIQVYNDTELTALVTANHWNGSGAAGDPYIIENLTIDGSGSSYGMYITHTDAYLAIRNCSLHDTINAEGSGAGIYLSNSNNVTISNNTFTNNDVGIELNSSNNNVITANALHDNEGGSVVLSCSNYSMISDNICTIIGAYGDGIQVFDSSHDTLENNTCINHVNGIVLNLVNNITVRNNICHCAWDGIDVKKGKDCNISNNDCSIIGDYQGLTGIEIFDSSNITVVGNTCDGYQEGLWLVRSGNCTIINNDFRRNEIGLDLGSLDVPNVISGNILVNNTYGIYMWNANNDTILSNSIIGSDNYGIYFVYANSKNNVISGNVFIGNNGASETYNSSHIQAIDKGTNYWNNSEFGNYWGDWTSPDDDGDGFVDAPYLIDGGANHDMKPLADPMVFAISPSSPTSTNRSSITVAGIAIDNENVSVVWHNEASGVSGTCIGNRTWAADIPLMEGMNNLTFTMSDALERASQDNITVVSDTWGPTINITSPSPGSLFDHTNVNIKWTASDNTTGISKMEMSIDGSDWSTASGLSYVLSSLSDGNHSFALRGIDAVGNVNITSVNFTVDTVAPSIIITSPTSGGFYNTSDITVTWTATDVTSGIDKTRVKIDGEDSILVTGTEYTTPSLTNGSHTVRVTVTDAAGNQNSSSVSFNIDDVQPSVHIDSPSNNSYNNTGYVTVTWTANDDRSGIAKTEIRIGNGTWTIVTGDEYTTPFLDDGAYTVTVMVTDLAGNANSSSVSFIVSYGPTIIASPGSPIYTNQNDCNVTIEMIDIAPLTTGNYAHYVNGVLKNISSIDSIIEGQTDLTHEFDLDLEAGTNVFTFVVNDSAGNSMTFQISITIDTDIPEVHIISPEDGSYNNTGVATIVWAGSDPISGIQRYELNVFNGVSWENYSFFDELDTNMTLTLADGNYTVYLEAFDRAGNVNATSISFIVDTHAPTVSITSPANSSYNNTGIVTVTWTASDVLGIAKIEVSTDGATWATANGMSKTLSLSDGSYTIRVRATDNAGNTNTSSVMLTVDTVKPIVRIDSPANNSYLNTSSVSVAWTASDASGIAKVEISTDGTIWTAVIGSSYMLSALVDGSYTVLVRATDNAGNVNETSASFVIDSVSPTISSRSPTGSDVPINTTVAVMFSESMNTSSFNLVVNGVSGTVSWSGNTSTFIPTSVLEYNKTYSVMVTGKDLAGNSVTTSWTFTTLKNEGEVSGFIIDASGIVIANATVTLSNGMSTTTDAYGHFVLNNVTSGSYTLTVHKEGYEDLIIDVTIKAGEISVLKGSTMTASSVKTDTLGLDSTMLMLVAVTVIAFITAVGLIHMKRKPKTL